MILIPLRRVFVVLLWLMGVPALAWGQQWDFQVQGAHPFLANGGSERIERVRGLGSLTAKFEHIYVFGDSLSDSETVATKSGGVFPPSAFYWGGRFSNGPTWNDYFAASVQVPQKSLAHAGARLVDKNNFYVVPSFLKSLWVDPIVTQIEELKKIRTRLDSKDLIVIWAGSNDYLLFPGRKSIDENMTAMKTLVGALQQLGAENFVVLNIPDVSRSPFHGLGIGRLIMEPAHINLWLKAHNKALETALETFREENPKLNVTLVDIYSAFTDILNHPEEFGFEDTKYPCIGGQLMPGGFGFGPFDVSGLPQFICHNPDQLFFWDPWHPSTHAHCLASATLLSTLADQGWVEGYDKERGLEACR